MRHWFWNTSGNFKQTLRKPVNRLKILSSFESDIFAIIMWQNFIRYPNLSVSQTDLTVGAESSMFMIEAALRSPETNCSYRNFFDIFKCSVRNSSSYVHLCFKDPSWLASCVFIHDGLEVPQVEWQIRQELRVALGWWGRLNAKSVFRYVVLVIRVK